jgi:ABC-type Na+ efflux pump permease subunit
MKIAPRLFAGLAAIALVLAGVTAVAPSPARAQSETGGTLLAVAIFAAVTVAAFALIDEEGDDEPQSP